MATTKIWPVRDNLARVLNYAENHLKTANPDSYTPQELKDLRDVLGYAASNEKTGKQHFITGVNCAGVIAYEQMLSTKKRFGKIGGNLAYHSYQSFKPDEVTPELCHQIGVELAKRIWGDRYEVLVTTHLDTNSLHNHFVINSVSFVDGKKLNNNYAMYFNNLRKQSDIICAEYGLSVIENPGKSKNRYMDAAEKRGEPTIWNIIRSDINQAIQQSMTEEHFYSFMKKWGYEFKLDPNRKYPTIRFPGAQRAVRLKTLGEQYIPDGIKWQLLENRRKNIRLLIVPPVKKNKHHYRYRGSYSYRKSFRGIYIDYLILIAKLQKIIKGNRKPNNPRRTRYTPELREAIRRIERYSKQTRLLCRYKIETPEQLNDFINIKNKQKIELNRERKSIYNKMAKAKSPERIEELKAKRDDLSANIKHVRTELFLADCVRKEREEIRRKLLAQRKLDARRQELEKPKTKIKERGHER